MTTSGARRRNKTLKSSKASSHNLHTQNLLALQNDIPGFGLYSLNGGASAGAGGDARCKCREEGI